MHLFNPVPGTVLEEIMKLETKLGLSTGGLILAMFLSAFTAHLRIQDANVLSNRVMADRMPLILNLRDVSYHIIGSLCAIESEMLFGTHDGASASYRAQRAEQMAAASRSLAAIAVAEGSLDLKDDKQRLEQVTEGLTQLRALQERVLQLSETNTAESTAEAYVVLQKEILPLSDSIIGIIEQGVDSQSAQAQSEFEQLRQANRLTILTLWLATIFGALAGGTISIVIGRRIARSVDQLAKRADSIAAGDLTGRALELDSKDEIGTLAEAMNGMQAALGGIIGTVAETAGSLTGSAASMRSASDQIHRRIDQQSQQTQQAATAMQEMSASIAEVSRHTQSAAETARAAAQTAREGGLIVKLMLGNMHSIASAVTETSSTVGLLGEDSKRISQIVTVIDEIARKTNLLALNAAIEAARAGDQGRGFAVVAGEVRRLAESTAQATGEIGNMIQEIQDRTRTAIASMAAGTGTVQEGVITTTQAGEALERIIGMAERVDRMITQIAIAASQQAAAADQSSASLDSIHSLSHENLTEMATTAAGIETLRGTAVTLERQVDRFQVQSHHAHSSRRAA
jgi:methyl-accepting chemotaxis protein